MSKREANLLVEDIIDSGKKILDYTGNLSFEDFTKDGKTIDAVIRNFEIICYGRCSDGRSYFFSKPSLRASSLITVILLKMQKNFVS